MVLVQLFLVSVAFNIFQSLFKNGAIASLLMIVGIVISLILAPMQTKTFLDSARGTKTTLAQVFEVGKKQAFNMLLLSLMTAIAIIVGLILLVIPGIIVAIKLWLAPYYLIDKGLSPTEAMKASWAATKGNTGKVWGIIGVGIVFALACLILVGIYFLIMYSAATAILYVYLADKGKVAAPATATPAA